MDNKIRSYCSMKTLDQFDNFICVYFLHLMIMVEQREDDDETKGKVLPKIEKITYFETVPIWAPVINISLFESG